MFRRHVIRSTVAALVLGSSLALTAACNDTTGRLYVRVGPPAPVYEVRSTAPGPGYIWIEGYHRWDGNRFVWTQGRWERPPHPRAVWVAGHWNHDGRGYYWVEGRWRG
jgi:hypothetical protein